MSTIEGYDMHMTYQAYHFARGASFVCTNQPEPHLPFSRDHARAPAQRQPLRNKCVPPDDPFHFASVYNENCAKRVRDTCYLNNTIKRMKLGRR